MPLGKYTTRSLWKTCWPGFERVTLRSRGSADGSAEYTNYSLFHALVGVANVQEEPMNGVVAVGLKRRRISIYDDDLDNAGAPKPKTGDLIVRVSDSTEWVVQQVENGLFENEHGCECQERA